MDELKGLLSLFLYAGMLKNLPRKGWVKKVGIKHAESVADHSYRVALISALVSMSRGLDPGKAALMALLHDLQESITGDRTPEEDRSDEERAFYKIVSSLDSNMKEALFSIWMEYKEGTSEEAGIVKQADKLEMAIQALEYLRSGHPKHLLEEFIMSAKKGIRDREFRELMGMIIDEFYKD